jgi:hypothetical protein
MEDMEHVPMSEEQRDVIVSALRTLELNASYLTSDERDLAKQLFYACGIVPFNATGEADTVLAYFSKREYFDAVISNDLDLLARGVETLLVPENYALPGDSSGWNMYTLSHILTHTKLTYTQFVDMCVLMGCDYTVGHKSLPYKSAYWAIKYGKGIECALKKHDIQDIEVYQKATHLLCGSTETHESLMGSKQWDKLLMDPPACESETLASFRKTHLRSLQESEYGLLLLDFGNIACDVCTSN